MLFAGARARLKRSIGAKSGGLQGQENRWVGLVVGAVLYERVKWLDVFG